MIDGAPFACHLSSVTLDLYIYIYLYMKSLSGMMDQSDYVCDELLGLLMNTNWSLACSKIPQIHPQDPWIWTIFPYGGWRRHNCASGLWCRGAKCSWIFKLPNCDITLAFLNASSLQGFIRMRRWQGDVPICHTVTHCHFGVLRHSSQEFKKRRWKERHGILDGSFIVLVSLQNRLMKPDFRLKKVCFKRPFRLAFTVAYDVNMLKWNLER